MNICTVIVPHIFERFEFSWRNRPLGFTSKIWFTGSSEVFNIDGFEVANPMSMSQNKTCCSLSFGSNANKLAASPRNKGVTVCRHNITSCFLVDVCYYWWCLYSRY